MDFDAEALLARLMRMPRKDRGILIRRLTRGQQREFHERWWQWAHPGRIEPGGDWQVWLIRAGRGFGKTRAGAEWVSELARGSPEARIALVGATLEDAGPRALQAGGLERTQAAMDGLLMIERCRAAEVASLDQRRAQSTARPLVGDGQAMDAAAHDEQIVGRGGEPGEIS